MYRLIKKIIIYIVIIFLICTGCVSGLIEENKIHDSQQGIKQSISIDAFGFDESLSLSPPLFNGSLSGYVTDSAMNPIQGARVRVHFHDTFEENYSDSSGYYHVTNIPICYCYKNATASKNGYMTEWVLMPIYENTTYNFTLTPLNTTGYITLSSDWNFISLPCNQSVDKTDIIIIYEDSYFDFSDSIVSDTIFGWNRDGQYYTFCDTLNPGEGYWLYASEPCELIIENSSVSPDDYITTVNTNWNIIGIPFAQAVDKVDILVNDEDWNTAVFNSWIDDVVFGWNALGQYYDFSNTFVSGQAYWVYSYQPCSLKRVI